MDMIFFYNNVSQMILQLKDHWEWLKLYTFIGHEFYFQKALQRFFYKFLLKIYFLTKKKYASFYKVSDVL